MNKEICYYTDNQLKLSIAKRCQKQLNEISKEKNIPIVSASLKQMPHFGQNIHIKEKRGILTMFRQILAALEASTADIIFFCEHDVLYHKSHFEFTPEKKDVFYYNVNVWKVRVTDGHSVKVDNCMQTSGLCAYRELLVGHYKRRIVKILQNQKDLKANGKKIKHDGFSRHMGFEPGGHSEPRGVDNYTRTHWESTYPNIDIRHDKNLTKNRWSPELFRNKKNCEGWLEKQKDDELLGWGNINEIVKQLN